MGLDLIVTLITAEEAYAVFPVGTSPPWPRRLCDENGNTIIAPVQTVTQDMHDRISKASRLVLKDSQSAAFCIARTKS